MVRGTPDRRSLALWEKRVILVAQEDFSGWKSTGRSVQRSLVTFVPNMRLMISGGGQGCHTSLTTWRRLATCCGLHLSINRTSGISRLATLTGSIRSLQEVSCRTGAAVIEPAEKDGRLEPALARRLLGDRTRVAPVPARAQSRPRSTSRMKSLKGPETSGRRKKDYHDD